MLRAEEAGDVSWSKIEVGKRDRNCYRCCLVPINNNSVFGGFSFSLAFVIQALISLRHNFNFSIEAVASCNDIPKYTWVSSAYSWWFTNECFLIICMVGCTVRIFLRSSSSTRNSISEYTSMWEPLTLYYANVNGHKCVYRTCYMHAKSDIKLITFFKWCLKFYICDDERTVIVFVLFNEVNRQSAGQGPERPRWTGGYWHIAGGTKYVGNTGDCHGTHD